MAVNLSRATLSALPSAAARPGYDPRAVTPGLLHFGLGNFHRAHQAIYLDDLMATGRALDWGVLGAGVMPGDKAIRDALSAQDWLGTVVEQSAERSAARVTGVHAGFLPVGDGAAIIKALADPRIRIVSTTITEGGYFINPATGRFDPEAPAIKADAANPAHPKTVFGLMLAGLKARRAAGIAPFTAMSCDNIPHNGVVFRDTLAGLARLSDPAFADWINDNVAFPNGMVDRITPSTGPRERRLAAEEHGINDAWPVFCEDFRQWVLEDHFPAGRPPLEDVGVQFVKDVTPFEKMKIRILNGGHAVIAYPAGLLDVEFVHEAMQDAQIAAFLEKIEQTEIIPVTPTPPGGDLQAYNRLIARRFANPKIGDTIRRLCLDGSNRQPKFIVPTLRDRLAQGADATGLALESALWRRYCQGKTESGAIIAPNDPNWERMTATAQKSPAAWLAMEDIYGDVARHGGFAARFAAWSAALEARGVRAVLAHYLTA